MIVSTVSNEDHLNEERMGEPIKEEILDESLNAPEEVPENIEEIDFE